jgi:hypothetical protein
LSQHLPSFLALSQHEEIKDFFPFCILSLSTLPLLKRNYLCLPSPKRRKSKLCPCQHKYKLIKM